MKMKRHSRAPAVRVHLDVPGLVVDNFAGGGGASLGIQWAIGRSPDMAINHDPEAVAMHAENHPDTEHRCEDVWAVKPREACRGRPVALAWFSPTCTDFSKAKGGKPVNKHIRGLAWVAVRWAREVRPKIIVVENVEEFQMWSPLLPDGTRCPDRRGLTFRRWVGNLRGLGYDVEWRELRASDFGAPTSRKRLFVIARCDGRPVVWPEPTHGPNRAHPHRVAAEIIDWSQPCRSIFERARPLAENTERRIARGLMRFVLGAAEPFIVPSTHQGDVRVHSLREPLRTITAARRGEFSLVAPTLITRGYGERAGQVPRVPGLDKPLGTIVAGGTKHALVSAFFAKHFGGNESPGAAPGLPLSTITARDHHALVTSNLVKLYGTCRDGQSVADPLPTIRAQGTHIAEVRAFLTKWYGQGTGQDLRDSLHTVTSVDRFGVVTVHGDDYVVSDIAMRMLVPRELYRGQGFPDSYHIDPVVRGKPLSKTAQVRMVGNSVCPQLAAAVVHANLSMEGVVSSRQERLWA